MDHDRRNLKAAKVRFYEKRVILQTYLFPGFGSPDPNIRMSVPSHTGWTQQGGVATCVHCLPDCKSGGALHAGTPDLGQLIIRC